MSAVILENVPSTFTQRFWNKIDFDDFLWIYWDWMDWIDKYWEVIPTQKDIKANQNYQDDISENDGETFLNNLISKKHHFYSNLNASIGLNCAAL
jgi:hypothetical protein